jgi:SNF1-activating kinase 1
MDERPRTAHRVENIPDAKTPPPRVYNTSNAESFAKAKEILYRKQELDLEQDQTRDKRHEVDPINVPCPPSPDDESFGAREGKLTRGNTMTTVKSSSTDSMAGVGTPLTSPSEATSPVASYNAKAQPDRMLVFHSDPSLPALLSGASSVSADLEGELLGRPGVVGTQPTFLETTDSLTPPAFSKEPTNGFPIDHVFENPSAMQSGHLNVDTDLESSSTPHMSPDRHVNDDDDNDDDDGSDDGIFLMAKSKKKTTPSVSRQHSRPFEARRRDTGASTASDETAKMVVMHDEATTPLESS